MIDAIWAARTRLKGVTLRTPLIRLQGPAVGEGIWIKLENLQPGGSYKIRGLYNRIALVKDEVKARGAKTVSAGNTAIACAIACRELGASLEVLMADIASPMKVEAVQALGGTVVRCPHEHIFEYIEKELWREETRFFVHPFGHPDVWAGHGTCALEILEDLPDVRVILVPIGGGGLITGVGAAVKALAPHVRVIGVQAAAIAPWPEAIRRRQPCSVAMTQPTIADGIEVPAVYPVVWDVAKDLIDGCLTVSEAEIKQAMRLLAVHNRVVAEGAGAVTTAAALKLDVSEGPVAAIITGGNIAPSLLAGVLAGDS